MRVVSAYLLALLGGNASPKAGDITKILESVGIEAESENVNKLIKELEGKDILEVIAKGREKLAAVPSGGGGGVAAAPTAGGGGGAAAGGAAAAEEKKKDESEEESGDEDMGLSLFD